MGITEIARQLYVFTEVDQDTYQKALDEFRELSPAERTTVALIGGRLTRERKLHGDVSKEKAA